MHPRNESIIRMFATRKALRLGVGLLLGILAVPILAAAANHYVRASATGNGSGSDWTNAYTDLPAKLVRGDIYYVAAGDYSPHTFSDALSGTQVITIRTATTSDHGTDSGWSDSYAGQVVFNGRMTVDASYYTFDGVYRSALDSGYGMKVVEPSSCSSQCYNFWIQSVSDGADISHITIQYVDMSGYGQGNLTPQSQAGFYAMNFSPACCSAISYVTLSHDYIHDYGNEGVPIWTGGMDHFTLEYSKIARLTWTTSYHSEGISDRGTNYVTIRYNVWEDIGGTGVIVDLHGAGDPNTANNWDIYGNVFWQANPNGPYNGVGNGTISCINNNICSNWNIYNNTFANFTGESLSGRIHWSHSDPSSSNIKVYDNVWYNSINLAPAESASGQVISDYNYYINSTGVPSETHGKTGSTNIFVDSANGDLHLASETPDGIHLSAPYDVDPDGVKRGSDNNIWSRGAYQYAPNSSSPDPPSNLVVNVH